MAEKEIYIRSMDILGNLPVEIAHKILQNLSIRDLSRCSMVNTTWHMLATDDRLWRKLTRNENLDKEKLVPPPERHSFCRYKRWYDRRQNYLYRWKLNSFWCRNIPEASHFAILGNGAVIVEVTETSLRVQDLSDGSPGVLIQTLSLPENCDKFFCVESFNSEYLVLRSAGQATIFLCYRWDSDSGRLEFLDGVYGGCKPTENIALGSIRSGGLPDARCGLHWRSLTLGADSLVLRTYEDLRAAYIWSITESRCLGVIDCRSIALGDIYSYKGNYYFCTFDNKLVQCDSNGVEKETISLSLVKYWLSRYWLHFNESILLLELSLSKYNGKPTQDGVYLVIAYEWDSWLEVTNSFNEHDKLALHPSRPWICYCKKHTYRMLFEIITKDIKSEAILWRVDFSPIYHESSLDGNHFGNLNFIDGCYVIFVPFDGSWESYVERVLLDAENGKVIFHDVLEKCHTIEYLGEKLVVVWDCRTEGNYRKKLLVYT